jgi:hypothetical protein
MTWIPFIITYHKYESHTTVYEYDEAAVTHVSKS